MRRLEIKVLDYIRQHHEGVLISDMELPLHQTRMKLGFITKNLVEEGKIIKIDNTYFPKGGVRETGMNTSLGP